MTRNRFDRSLYLGIFPFLTVVAAGVTSLALLWPDHFGVTNRYFLVPFAFFVVLSVCYFSLIKAGHRLVLWLPRVRMGVGILALAILFYHVDVSRSDLWTLAVLPYLGLIPNSSDRTQSRLWLTTYSFVAVAAFLRHFPANGSEADRLHWALMFLAKGAAILGIAGCAWMVRRHDRQQRRALSAAYNKLAQKQKQIIQTERFAALGELSSGVAHEINNSLIVLIGGLDEITAFLHTTHPGRQDMNRHLERMDRATDRIRKVVNQMRSLSRDGRRDPATKFDLRTVVNDALFLVREQLSTRNITWRVDLPREAVIISGHPAELAQVLINLINNARDALETSETRSIVVGLGLHHEQALLHVTDTGPGIPESVQNRMFTPFVTTKPVGKGTGLGLSISFGIIKRHQGQISYQTSPKGTSFTIELPLAEAYPFPKAA